MIEIEADHFCSKFASSHRHLSTRLDTRLRTISDLAKQIKPDDLVSIDPGVLADQILSTQRVRETDEVGRLAVARVQPRVLSQDLGQRVELRRGDLDGERLFAWQWEFSLEWFGPPEFGFWPDLADGSLRTFENHTQIGAPPEIKWHIGPSDLVALCYTSETLPQSDHPEDLYDEALAFASVYCDAFNKQVSDWTAQTRAELVQQIAGRQQLARQGRAARDRINEQLDEWRTEPLELAPKTSLPTTATDMPQREEVQLPPPLSDASIDQIIKVLNRWVDAVELHSAAYVTLQEERLSDQVVATLNGAFGRAHREVFIGGGRSDFYVTSNIFNVDGNADIFVGESKFWEGESEFIAAVDQTLNNLTHRTLSAVLLVFVKNRKSFTGARGVAHQALMSDDRFIAVEPDIAGRPTYVLKSALDPEARVRLTVVLVDMTRSPETLPKSKGRATTDRNA